MTGMEQSQSSLVLSAGTTQEAADRLLAMDSLACYIKKIFNRNADHRRNNGVDARLLKCLRMARGVYTPQELAAFKQAGVPPIFSGISDTKRRAAMAMLSEIFANPGDKPWTLKPTPKPAVLEHVTEQAVVQTMRDYLEYVALQGVVPPPEAIQAYAAGKVDELAEAEIQWAKEAAERMERKVHDLMVEGGWGDAFSEYNDFICTYGTGVIKGPVARVRRRKELKRSKAGTQKYRMVDKIVLEYEAVNPWDCFPSPGAKRISDGEFCQRVRFTPGDLRRYANAKGSKGWRVGVVNTLLELNPVGGIRELLPSEYERRLLETDGIDMGDDCLIEGVEFWGEVRGSVLWEMNIFRTGDNALIEEGEYYEVNAITVQDKIIFCRIVDQEIGRPLSKGVFYESPGSWWGDSLIEKMEGMQKIANSSLRNLVVNMAQASGPQTVIKDLARLDPSCSLEQRPWKVWIFNSGTMGDNGNPLHMFQPDSNADALVKSYDWAIKQSDIETGIPAYTYGSNIAAGAARTASGLAMLTEAASRGIKMVVGFSDKDVIRASVKRTCDWLMLYDDDESIKGDVEVNPAGVMGLILREQESTRRRAFLQLTANPIDMQIIGVEGRAVVLREEAKSLDVNPDDVVPTKAKLREIAAFNQAKEQLALQQGQAEAQAAQQQGQQPQEEPLPQQPGQAQVDNVRQHPQARAMRGIGIREQNANGVAA